MTRVGEGRGEVVVAENAVVVLDGERLRHVVGDRRGALGG